VLVIIDEKDAAPLTISSSGLPRGQLWTVAGRTLLEKGRPVWRERALIRFSWITNILVHANVAESPRHRVALDTVEQLSEAGVEIWASSAEFVG